MIILKHLKFNQILTDYLKLSTASAQLGYCSSSRWEDPLTYSRPSLQGISREWRYLCLIGGLPYCHFNKLYKKCLSDIQNTKINIIYSNEIIIYSYVFTFQFLIVNEWFFLDFSLQIWKAPLFLIFYCFKERPKLVNKSHANIFSLIFFKNISFLF